MKIALINPPVPGLLGLLSERPFAPLGLGCIAAYLRRGGHEVRIFSPHISRLKDGRMWEPVEKFAPDIAGFTSVTPNFMIARELAVQAKARLGCLVVMGGPHVTAIPRSSLESAPALDAVIRGEGEIPMLALADQFDASGKVDFAAVPGAAYLAGGGYREVPRPDYIADLDGLPYPARDLSDTEDYAPDARSMRLISSRGCPGQCTFCGSICMGRKFRARSPEQVAGEMAHLAGKYGVRSFNIVDDCFTADPARAAKICDLIVDARLKVSWTINGRVNTLQDEGLLRKLKRAGCVQVLLGIESGNQRILDLMKKGTTLAAAEECCARLRRHGIACFNSFILGNEGEDWRTALDTISFSKKLGSELVLFGRLMPSPGTPVFEKYYKDFDRPDTDWDRWSSMLPVQPCENRHTALSQRALYWLTIWAYLRYFLDPVQLLRLMFCTP